MIEPNKDALFEASEMRPDFAQINKTEFPFSGSETLDIFINVFVFFGTLTADGFVLSLAGKIFDRTATEPQLLIGQKFSETVYWQSSEHTAEKLERAVKESSKGSAKVCLDFRVDAVEKIYIELFLHPVYQGQNDLQHIFFCAHDVTTREKQLEYFKARSEQLLDAAENAEIGLWFWNLVEDSFYITPKCEEFFEISAKNEDVSLRSFLGGVHAEDRRRVEEALRDSQVEGKEFKIEYRAVYSDGAVHWLDVQGKTYLDDNGSPQNMMGVVRRVTDKKIASQELAKVYERERRARDESEEANRAKDFFLAVVSHELRSPLNTILGWTKILLAKNPNEEVRKNALETIEKSARAQAKLIDDLIDSARVSSGKLRLELRSVNLFEVLKTVYNSQKPLTDQKNVLLEFSTDSENLYVFGDPVRLQQVFTNLVSNALKFTAPDGTIKINARIVGNQIEVSVSDNGQGISPEFLPNVFQQFKQGDEKASSDRSGLGLGLSIVKILAEKHNGQIKAQSEGIGRGSIFTVTMPLLDSQESPANDEAREVRGSNAPIKPLADIKILVVEDDPDSREVLQLFLEQSGASVESAESVADAMNLLSAAVGNLPDIIISDLAMPNEDGYSFITRVRSLPSENGGSIPAVALSAFASTANKEQAFSCGFQKYHTKPFEPDGIVQDILSLLKKQ